jgi:hypothetical protein
VVRAVGVEPTRAVKPCGFSCRLRLSPPGQAPSRSVRFAVWTIPSPSPRRFRGLRRCPSSLYTFPAELSVRAWLGIAISGFPEFGQFCIASFPASTQVFLSPLRMPFRHARVAVKLRLPMIKQSAGIYTSEFGRAASERLLAVFGVFLGLMMLIAAASRFVLMCAA